MPGLQVALGELGAAFGLGEATPDPVRFAHPDREIQTVAAHVTLRADRLGVGLTRFTIVAPLRRRRRKEQS
jgi:hypothetical protein